MNGRPEAVVSDGSALRLRLGATGPKARQRRRDPQAAGGQSRLFGAWRAVACKTALRQFTSNLSRYMRLAARDIRGGRPLPVSCAYVAPVGRRGMRRGGHAGPHPSHTRMCRGLRRRPESLERELGREPPDGGRAVREPRVQSEPDKPVWRVG